VSATEVLQRFDLLSWEMMAVEARDGFSMPAQMVKPRFFDEDKKYPAVLYVYGGPLAPRVVNAWDSNARNLYHRVLAEQDVIVFYLDNRSAAGRSRTSSFFTWITAARPAGAKQMPIRSCGNCTARSNLPISWTASNGSSHSPTSTAIGSVFGAGVVAEL
jgi:hypothetical protein